MTPNYTVLEKVHKDPYTYVKIASKTSIGGKAVTLVGQGFTKRNACDTPNPNIGYEVALSRAIEDLRGRRTKLKKLAKKYCEIWNTVQRDTDRGAEYV